MSLSVEFGFVNRVSWYGKAGVVWSLTMHTTANVPVCMTVAEFLAWEPGDGRMWQLVDGEPKAMMPARPAHGALHAEMGALISNHFVAQNSVCSVLMNVGVLPHLRRSHNLRIPALAITCSDYRTEEDALTDPVLVIEILSPDNVAETWANVWAYASIPSVREILVLSSMVVGADLLCRRPDSYWPGNSETILDGDLALESIDLRGPLADIHRTTRLRRPPGDG